ncbi:MAG: energy-coupling factor transporter transmembrane protein EcfT [Lachnospiraceae bacterium]|nr:energy-coupling factor transporter transmembrane protein EcfT [Lachnospiraceae bacterium]
MDFDLILVRLTGRILKDEGRTAGPLAAPGLRIQPVSRLAAAFCCILFCALSRNAVFTGGVLAVLLLRTALLPEDSMRRALGKTVLPVLFTLLITLPAVFTGSPGTMATVTMKVLESVLVLALTGEALTWQETTGALRALHLPGIFVMTLDMTVRGLVILGRYADRVTEAVWLRTVGGRAQSSVRNAGTGGVLGGTFLHSRRIAAATEEAMECRCFDGEYRDGRKTRLHRADALYLLMIPAMAGLFALCERAMH